MGKVSIQDIAKFISDKHGLSRQEAEAFVTAVFDVISEGLDAEKSVKVKGLGTFKVIDVRERESVNVNTGERVVIGGHGKITFTPDTIMRDLVNKPFAQFETVVLNEGVDLDEMSKTQTLDEDADVQDGDVLDDEGGTNEAVDLARSDVSENGERADEELCQEAMKAKLQDEDGGQVEQERPEDVPEYANDNGDDNEESECLEEEENQDLQSDITHSEKESDDDRESEEQTEVVSLRADENTDINGETGIDDAMADETVIGDTENVSDEHIEEASPRRYKGWVLLVSSFVTGVLALAVGYFIGHNTVEPIVKYKTVRIVTKPSSKPVSQVPVVKMDSTTVAAKADTASSVKPYEPKEVSNTEAEIHSQALKNAQAVVNTGAYRIVGTAKTITVKAGETLESISRLYFGNGMECYVQVYNGVVDVKEGMTLKIPKLELKRKR